MDRHRRTSSPDSSSAAALPILTQCTFGAVSLAAKADGIAPVSVDLDDAFPITAFPTMSAITAMLSIDALSTSTKCLYNGPFS
jgi:hypothetical protein